MDKKNITIDHIGWITEDIDKFESFWCNIIGYKLKYESILPVKMSDILFKIKSSAEIRRYSKEKSIDIEIHKFTMGSAINSGTTKFNRLGINHICLHLGEKNSRVKFLNTLPPQVKRYVYDNPGGWQNIFIQDFEDNWIELREDL